MNIDDDATEDDDADDADNDDDARGGGGEGGSGHTGWLKVSRRSLYSVLTDHHHSSWLLGDHIFLSAQTQRLHLPQ